MPLFLQPFCLASADLCLQKQRGTWAPSAEALRSIFQQKKFTSLEGAAEPQGDLKSVVMHSMKVMHVSSTFPVCTCQPASNLNPPRVTLECL